MAIPIETFRTVDVYGFVDSDTNEAKQFRTYLFYWRQLARRIKELHGDDPVPALVTILNGSRAYRGLSSRQFRGDSSDLEGLLLNSWSNELMLYVVDDDDPRLLTATQWLNVYVYYATGMSALGWLLVRDSTAPTAHRRLLSALSAQVAARRTVFPEPWSCHIRTHQPPGWGGFGRSPGECSNLSSVDSVDSIDGIGKLIRTTHRKRVEEIVEQTRRERGVRRLANGERQRIEARLEPTTIFDFAWRSRVRANYGSPAMFFKGSLGSIEDCVHYVQALRTFADSTMLLFEAFVGQRARKVLVDAATEFIARDRTRQSDALVGRRLRELGLLA